MKYLFLDESGDHSLTRIDPQYPVFVLGGVIVDADYADGEMAERVHRFKLDTIGRADVVLHTADIVRARGACIALDDEAVRQAFVLQLNDLMRSLEYKVVACAIDKPAHRAAYGNAALDPYMLSLNVIVERFCFEIAESRDPMAGRIFAESRDPALDAALRLAWETMRVGGTSFLSPKVIRQRVAGLHLRDKKAMLPGLEFADLVVSPIGRYVAGLPPRADFAIVEEKLRRRGGEYWGAGLIVLPKG